MNRQERRAQRRRGTGFSKLPGSAAAATHCSAGLALAAQGKLAAAAASFRMAIAARPGDGRAHNNLGIVLAQTGNANEAEASFRAALACEPALPEACTNLGHLLLDRGEAEAALAVFMQALRLRPGHAGTQAAVGRALLDLGRLTEAVGWLEAALRLMPDCADALHHLAIARQFQGALREAEDLCARSVALTPRAGAYLTLSQIRRFGAGDPALAEMEALASGGTSMPAADRVALHFALGKAYDDCGENGLAFGHFLRGNALKRACVAYDEAATLDVMRWIQEVFDEAVMRKVGAGGAAPIFILGMPRSGSTLLEQILCGHPEIVGGGERTDFARVAGAVVLQEGVGALRAARLREMGAAYLAGLGDLVAGSARVTDKMPGNFLYAGLIALVFPAAKIIHTRRDPIDTCFSCYTQLFRAGHLYSYELGELGRYYAGYRRLMAHWRRVMPDKMMLEVDYEALVASPEREVRRILAHCGLGWSESCLAFAGHSRAVVTASATQVREGLHGRSVRRWRRYAEGLGPLMAALGEAAKE